MADTLSSNIAGWLQVKKQGDGLYELTFTDHHIGNPWIRSIHGGVTGSLIELAAEQETRAALDDNKLVTVTTNTIDYLRVTKDENMHARAKIIRMSRRLSIVDVVCWQDDEATPVARGTVTLKVGNAVGSGS